MASKKSHALFDKVVHVKSVIKGESLRFRDVKGRAAKYDGRKKLVAEIWLGNKKTNRVLNNTKHGKAVPQKFYNRYINKQLLLIKSRNAGPRANATPKQLRILIDAHYTIEDNLEAKADVLLTDITKFSKRGNGAHIVMEFPLNTEEGTQYQVIQTVIKSSTKQYAIRELAALIISRLYRNKLRMSNLKISPLGTRGAYVRSIKITFTWYETKPL